MVRIHKLHFKIFELRGYFFVKVVKIQQTTHKAVCLPKKFAL